MGYLLIACQMSGKQWAESYASTLGRHMGKAPKNAAIIGNHCYWVEKKTFARQARAENSCNQPVTAQVERQHRRGL